MEEERWCSFHLAEVERLSALGETRVFYAPEVPCLLVARQLDWDKKILGVSIASLDYLLFPDSADADHVRNALGKAHQEMRERGWQLLIHKSSPRDRVALSVLGGCQYDLLTVHLDFLFSTDSAAREFETLEGFEFAEARADEESILGELSSRNHCADDRFSIDPLLPRERIKDLYGEWARNSVRGYADLVWVARKDERPVGFGTWGLRRRLAQHTGVHCAEYQLGAVERSESHRGVFRRVTAAALARLRELGEEWASGATNALNFPAQRCFQSLEARCYQVILTYRKDLSRD